MKFDKFLDKEHQQIKYSSVFVPFFKLMLSKVNNFLSLSKTFHEY